MTLAFPVYRAEMPKVSRKVKDYGIAIFMPNKFGP